MKKTLLFLSIPLLIAGLMLFTSFGGDENSDYPSGSPAGYTGSPGDGKDCIYCHGGSSSLVEGWITSDIPQSGYIPGNVYNITVTVTGSGDKGFQVSPQDPSGNELGTLIAGPGSHLNGGTKYVNQNSKKTSNPAIWEFQWTAPLSGTGEVTFYGAFTVNKPVTKTSTLVVLEGTLTPLEADATANPDAICTGDSSHLDVTASGGTGTYTYVWTSDPAGFTSSVKDPWVFPTESTKYFVEVTSGDIHATDSVEVAVFCLSAEDNLSELNLSLFPNPFTDWVNLSFSGVDSKHAELMVFSVSGKSVLRKQLLPEPFSFSAHVDLSALPAGSYILRIRDGKNQVTRKISRIN